MLTPLYGLRHLTASLVVLALAVGVALSQNVTALHVMKTDGSGVRRIAAPEGFARNGHPRWSHDGSRLAFHAWDGPQNAKQVFVVNFDASGLRKVGSHGQLADWSPDDKQIVFQNRGDPNNQIGSWVENLDGSGRTFLTDGLSPRWSPDGARLAFLQNRQLFVRDLVGGDQVQLSGDGFEDIQAGLDWSPDGRRIALVGKRDGNWGLWMVDTHEPGGAPQLRMRGNLLGQVAWSPDGKKLAITLDSKIQLLPAAGNTLPHPIPGQTGASRDPAWSPDGKWIAFSSNRDE